MNDFRTGFGYDVHRLVEGRKLILGGIIIPFEKGLEGHSDADALLHAITDAILGAAALGDIGSHFPDTDERYRGADSKELLRHAAALIKNENFSIGNVDTTIVLQKPKLSPFIESMRKSISDILNTDLNRVSVKATTEEGMGFVGSEDGIKVYASIILIKYEK